MKSKCSKLAVKSLSYGSWFHLMMSFEHFDVISMVDNRIDHDISVDFLNKCRRSRQLLPNIDINNSVT